MPGEKHGTLRSLVAGIALFAPLDDKGLERAARGSKEIDASPGTVLFSRGDACGGLYFVIAGLVKLALPVSGRAEKVIALLGPGESFEESAVFLNEPHLVSAEALERTKLVHVTKATLSACMDRDPTLANRMVMLLSRRLNQVTREVENAVTLTGTQRVLDFLIAELPETAQMGAARIVLPAKKHIIASRLDLTHEHFSRILHDLCRASLLEVQGPAVTITDVRRLLAYRVACAQVARSKRSGVGQPALS